MTTNGSQVRRISQKLDLIFWLLSVAGNMSLKQSNIAFQLFKAMRCLRASHIFVLQRGLLERSLAMSFGGDWPGYIAVKTWLLFWAILHLFTVDVVSV